MALNREAVFAALATRLQALTPATVTTFSRKLKAWEDVPTAEQPALFLAKGPERAQYQQRGLPAIWRLEAKLYLWCRNDADPYAGPSIQLNTILQAVESALEWQAADGGAGVSFPAALPGAAVATTLGGLVSYARIVSVETDEGVLGDQAAALVTVEMLATE